MHTKNQLGPGDTSSNGSPTRLWLGKLGFSWASDKFSLIVYVFLFVLDDMVLEDEIQAEVNHTF